MSGASHLKYGALGLRVDTPYGTPYGTRYGRGHAIRDARLRHTGRVIWDAIRDAWARHMGRAHASRQLGASLVPAWCRLGPRRCRLGACSVPACHGASSVPARSPAGRRQKRRIVPNREACNKIPNRDILKKDAIGVVKTAIKSEIEDILERHHWCSGKA